MSASDFSRVAVRFQQRLASDFLTRADSAKLHGSFTVTEHDFTQGPPGAKFDVVINCRAFQGLSPMAMSEAAKHFHAALRPGGACILDTMNVQGERRNSIEESLLAAGFYIPFQKSERWHREQLGATGIVYGMVLGRPRISFASQYPPEHFTQFAERDQRILDSFRAEYEQRCQEEAAEVNATANDPRAIVAHVVYATG